MSALWNHYPELESCHADIDAALDLIVETYRHGGKLLICGNGGSAADSEHIAGELLKGFLSKREVNDPRIPEDLRKQLQGSLPAIPLPSISAAFTATLNDMEPTTVYAQLLYGLGKEGDLLVAISTSGNAKNVNTAAQLAKALGISVLALTGEGGGALSTMADVAIRVPSRETYRVQEYHLPVYHHLCAETERILFGEE